MKLLSKYELRERITGRPVEVFLAQETRTGLSRLVHLVEWKDGSREVTGPEVVKLICRWAPAPPGIILEAGRDETTSNAYLVTTLPADPFEVQAWVQSYEGSSKGVPEIQVEKTEPDPKAEPADLHEMETASIPVFNPEVTVGTASGSGPGEFTRAFRGLGPLPPPAPSSDAPAPQTTAPKVPVRAEGKARPEISQPAGTSVNENHDSGVWTEPKTGSFTKEFLGRLGNAPLENDAPRPQTATPGEAFPPSFSKSSPKKEGPGIFSDMDIPPVMPGADSFVESGYGQTEPEEKAKAKTGEFTEFFRGVGAQRLGSANEAPPKVEENRRAEFDPGFRAGDREPGKGIFDDQFFANSAKPKSSRFGENLQAPEPLASPERDQRAKIPAPRFDSPGEFGGDGKSQNYAAPATSAPGRSPNFQQRASSIPEPVWDREASPADATRVFSPQAGAPMPRSFPEEEGPSEFTQVIRRGAEAPPPAEAPTGQKPASGSAEFKLPGVQAPKLPPANIPPVKMPPAPLPPAVAAPKIAAPKAPAVPAPAPVSYLPLIIGLNVVLVLAIAFVLYFVLKAH